MKKILITIIAGLCFQLVIAQVKEGKIVYERKTNMHKRLPPENENMKAMIPEFNTGKQQLLFAADESIFSSLPDEEDIRDHAGEDGNRINFRMGGGNNETYKNYATEKIVELRELGPKKYIIEDTLKKLAWKLADDTMNIKGYHCKKATTKNRQGDNIVAWYTEEISTPSGPEQFGGLPGLILKLDIGESWIVFTALDIVTGTGKQLVKAPSGAKKITRPAFQKMMDEAFGPGSGNGGPQIRIITRDGGGGAVHNN
ncbi:MAG: GLPGLI family protein [Chitinophagaceae bacterium]